MGADIPSLFGDVFNTGKWNSGHMIVQEKKAHVLLITLNKQGKSKEHRYTDYWQDENTIHWQTQNSTTPNSAKGSSVIHHIRDGWTIHLFVRENKVVNGKASPFTYFGEVDYVSHTGSAPMSVILVLK